MPNLVKIIFIISALTACNPSVHHEAECAAWQMAEVPDLVVRLDEKRIGDVHYSVLAGLHAVINEHILTRLNLAADGVFVCMNAYYAWPLLNQYYYLGDGTSVPRYEKLNKHDLSDYLNDWGLDARVSSASIEHFLSSLDGGGISESFHQYYNVSESIQFGVNVTISPLLELDDGSWLMGVGHLLRCDESAGHSDTRYVVYRMSINDDYELLVVALKVLYTS